MRERPVVAFGLCVVDHAYVVDDLELTSARTRSHERRVSSGGMACNAAIQAASLGVPTRLVTVLGDDADGHWLRSRVRGAGVDVRGVRLEPGFPTTVSVVLVARRGGERRFIVPDRRKVERNAPALDLAAVRSGSLLLVDGHFPDQALKAVKRARELGATVIADFAAPRPAYLKLLPYVDHPIVPLEFAEAYGAGDPHRALRTLRDRFGGDPIVTMGGRGGLYLRGNRIRRYKARRVRVRDTTGAGDAFHGAFAAGLARGRDVEGAISLAARAAATCCTAVGATTRLIRR